MLSLFKRRKKHHEHDDHDESSWRKHQHGFFSGIVRKISSFLLLAAVLGVVGMSAGYVAISRELPKPEQLVQRKSVESSKIFDRTGKTLLYEIHGDVKRTYVPVSELPPYIAQAAIAVEDKDFYFHHGINFKSIVKAFYEKIFKGGRLRGASTITQQLVKNAVLSNERSWLRKFKEAILSLQIERQYSKDQILELYLNEIPYGSVVYGIESASQTFFNKNAKDLTLPEAAILAGIPKAPTYYSPFGTNTDALIERQHIILQLMADQGYITQDEADLYQQEPVKFAVKKENIIAPHFVMYVRDILAKEYGEQFLEEGGLKIVTTLDLDKQKIAEEVIAERAPINKDQWNASNAALVAVDTPTGQIVSMVGSVDFFDTENDGQVNVALRPRQPGSSFKPMVYTAAFEKGYTPETVLYDVNTTFKDICVGDPNYEPKNYSLKEFGAVTARQALQGSLNISAVKMLYLTGINRVIDFAGRLGYTTFEPQRGRLCLSLVLGGAEVKLLEHVGGFSVFAQEGMKHKLTPILEITDKQGNNIAKYQDENERVLDTNVARTINNVLSDNNARSFIFGPNSTLQIPGRPVAAKTGTTNDYRDAWMMGYTPSLAAGVWVGNNDNSEMKRGSDGSVLAGPIWNAFMKRSLSGKPVESFGDLPASGTDKPVLNGATTQETTVMIDSQSGLLATEYTPPKNRVQRTYHPMHSILHYVDKENPRGPVPENPAQDQQYIYWEAGIKGWAERQGITIDFPPTSYDNIHTKENKPFVNIISPSSNETITNRNINVDISASAPRGVSYAEYYIDDVLLTSVHSDPFDLSYTLRDEVRNGFHTLKAVVYDDLDNFAESSVTINILVDPLQPSFSWKNIQNEVTLASDGFPYSFRGTINNVNSVKKIEVRYEPESGGKNKLIASASNPSDSNYAFRWESSPPKGVYTMYVLLTDTKGVQYQSSSIRVTVNGSNGTSPDQPPTDNNDTPSILDILKGRKQSRR